MVFTKAAVATILLLLASPPFVLLTRACNSPTVDSRREGEAAVPPKLAVAIEELPSGGGGAGELSGVAIMAAVNEVAAEQKPDEDVESDCETGFVDEKAIKTAACPAGGDNQTVDWAAYDDAYAAAPVVLPTEYLTPPVNCTFGCVPLVRGVSFPMESIGAAMPWRGKCFTDPGKGEMVNEPTAGNGSVVSTPVPLLTRAMNMIDASLLPVNSRRKVDNSTLAGLAPANVYICGNVHHYVAGESAFDGEPTLVVDYHGMDEFNTFRDEMRYVGCGVWLGKTFLTGPPTSLPQSLASVGGVSVDNILLKSLITALPAVTPGAALPGVMDFVLFQLAPEVAVGVKMSSHPS